MISVEGWTQRKVDVLLSNQRIPYVLMSITILFYCWINTAYWRTQSRPGAIATQQEDSRDPFTFRNDFILFLPTAAMAKRSNQLNRSQIRDQGFGKMKPWNRRTNLRMWNLSFHLIRTCFGDIYWTYRHSLQCKLTKSHHLTASNMKSLL